MINKLQGIIPDSQYDINSNSIKFDAKLVLGVVDLGDAPVELSEDSSGVVIHIPHKIKGYHPGTEFEITHHLIQEEPKIPLYQAIEIRDQLRQCVEEIEVLIKIATNKENSKDTISALNDLKKNAAIRLEKLENKLRTISI